ncbi:MAG: DNA replication/repair protein RecF [Candidatus Saccharimonadales bacterium]
MITSLRLQNFRSYVDESFELDQGVNIIVGPNASGKTNLLESIMVICRGSSFRVKDSELISYNSPWTRIDALNDDQARTVKFMLDESGVRKEYSLDSVVYSRLHASKHLPVVLFEPNHLQLLSGSPEKRRLYLDDILEQIKPGFGPIRRKYRRALMQRNALLKHSNVNHSHLFAWNIRISELGGIIALERIELTALLNERLEGLYVDLAKRPSTLAISYTTPLSLDQYSTHLLKKLEEHQFLDIQRGFTSYGPHREDISIQLNDHTAQETASRGEIRTILLCMKLVEINLIEQTLNIKPILLLDDVFSELDGARRKALTEILQQYQTFITTTDADVVLKNFINSSNLIALESAVY